MNYQRIYNQLIARSATRIPQGYTEKHHIIPRCMGGSDDISNIAILTAEEHYLAHQLLVKIYPDNGKLIFAAKMMTVSSKGQLRNNKEYGWIKRKYIKYLSEYRKGKYYPYKEIFRTDPYIIAMKLAPIADYLHCYKRNPYRLPEDIIIPSNLFLKLFER